MRAALLGTAAVAALVLVGCGSSDGAPQGSPSGTPSGTASCGEVSLGQGESAIPEAVLGCFADASAAGTPATLVVLSPTVEGDVITTTYTVVDTGRVRMVLDTTQDAFAGDGAGITQQTCDLGTAGGQITVTNCTEPQPV